MQRVYDDEGMEFDRLNLLGAAYRGLTDIGEVLITLDQIPNGDREAWVREFAALGERLRSAADASKAGGHQVSARSSYLRACSYLASASANAPGTKDPGRYETLWEQHRECWDLAVDLSGTAIERVRIPYEDTQLEGYFFHGGTGEPLPTVILNNGSDGAVSEMWAFGGAAAVERGWNAMTFDGPGQNAALHRQKLYFRADWEKVVTPVVDWLLARPEVDDDRVVLHGVSQAGYWVPRAVAFEHRIAAAVADPGCMRVADSWEAHLPDFLKQYLAQNDKKDFDDVMDDVMKNDPTLAGTLRWRMAPYGTDSVYDAYKGAEAMHLDAGTLAQITCPLLLTAPDHEQFWPGHSEEIHKLVPSSTVVTFTEAEGADWHCEPAAHALRDERIFDWLEDVVTAS